MRNKDGTTTQLPSGDECEDRNGDHIIDFGESAAVPAPRDILGLSGSLQQATADLMQLVRVIQVGMDVDGDGLSDIDASRISYFGISFGGASGFMLLAIDPDVRAAVHAWPGGLNGRNDLTRERPAQRGAIGEFLQSRSPSLLNAPGKTSIGGVPVAPPFFDEEIPLRDQPVAIASVSGSFAIQDVFARIAWAQQASDGAAYAPYVRAQPLPGVPAKSLLVVVSKTDQTAPNPRTTAVIRAGRLEDRVTFHRNDLAFAADGRIAKDPHGFMQAYGSSVPLADAIARGGLEQAAAFLESGGETTPQALPAEYFEVPIVLPLPERYSYIP